ncbi:MAG: thioesterase family protein [Verrucomicrobiota bacterium]
MKSRPRIGTVGELKFVVEQKHVIDFANEGMPAVLSTPNLIGLLERTAREALQPFLEPNERTVGIEIDIRHLAPTPLGQAVTCTARVIQAEGSSVTLQLEARDEHELIARGVHKRAVVRVESFARRVARKAASA